MDTQEAQLIYANPIELITEETISIVDLSIVSGDEEDMIEINSEVQPIDSSTSVDDSDVSTNDSENTASQLLSETESSHEIESENDAMKEILALVKEEEEEENQLATATLSDADTAIAAEKEARENERIEEEQRIRERKEKREAQEAQEQVSSNRISDRIRQASNKQYNSQSRKQTASATADQVTPEARSVSGSSRMSGNSAGLNGLFGKLGGSAQDSKVQERAAENKERAHRWAGFQLPREISRPVERTMEIYEDDSTSLYDVLRLPLSAGEEDIRRAYRSLVFDVHPDRNPHPDAKKAFDYVHEAHQTLSSSERAEYDRRVKNKRRWSGKKLQQRYRNAVEDLRARSLLLMHRLRNGLWREELKEVVFDRWTRLITRLHRFAEKVVLLPSIEDRMALVNEIYQDNWIKIGLYSMMTRLFLSQII